MTPKTYQGPMQGGDEEPRTFSQTLEDSLGSDQPGVSVAAILVDKGSDIFTIGPETTVRETISELNRMKVGALLVVESGDVPQGIVSERDIVRAIDAKGPELFDLPVKEIMTPNPVTCSPEETVEQIAQTMTHSRFRHMPVMKQGRLCGVISIGDVVRQRLLELEYENLKMKQAIVG